MAESIKNSRSKLSDFRKKSRGGVVRGVRIVYGDGAVVDRIAQSDMDFIYLDQQHGTISIRDIYEIVALLATYDILVLVRTPDQRALNIGLALDAGAHGVIAPDIESAGQAQAFVSNTRYPPSGNRSWGAFAAGQLGYSSPVEAVDPICWVLIESPKGVEDIGEISAIKGVDGIYIGRYDLALSLDIPFSNIGKDEDHNAVIASVRSAAEKVGLPIGTSGEFAQLRSQGFRILTVPSELELLSRGLATYLSSES